MTKMARFACPENDTSNADSASSVENTTRLSDIALFIGTIKGTPAKKFFKLNQHHI